MAKGILSQRAVLFVVGVLFFLLITLRLLFPYNNKVIPDLGNIIDRQHSMNGLNHNYTLYESVFGGFHSGLGNSISSMPIDSITMNPVTSIQLIPQNTITMESSSLYKLETIGKLKMDSTGAVMFEPVGAIHLTPLHHDQPQNETKTSSPIVMAKKDNEKPVIMPGLAAKPNIDNISPQHAMLINPSVKTTVDPLLLALVSPGAGTDIISKPRQLLEIYNQSRAIIPKLDLNGDFKVYFCKHLGHGVRFFFLARESLLLHPRIHLVDDPSQAQFIVYLPVSSPWHKTECNNPTYRNRTIVLDEGDGPGLFEVDDNAGKWFLYFKRSFVSRHKGIFQGYMPYVSRGDIFPMTYTTAEAYIKLQYNLFINRDLEIVCTLRGSNHDPVRLRVREWIEEYVKARGIKNAVAGQINAASRTVISKEYFNNMYRAKIIVTSNPSGWEGDFRFCEALSSGALIFIDHMYVPRPNPFIHNQHIVYYDNNNKTDLFDKLDYYRLQRKLTADIAMQGYLHAMKYHRAVNLADYIFKTVHLKLQTAHQLRGSKISYDGSGYDMLKSAQDNIVVKQPKR